MLNVCQKILNKNKLKIFNFSSIVDIFIIGVGAGVARVCIYSISRYYVTGNCSAWIITKCRAMVDSMSANSPPD